MDEIRPYAGLGGAPIVVALVELVKRTWPSLEARWYPLLAAAFGILLSLGLALLLGTHLGVAVVTGLLSGLSAGGLYSGGKATVVEPLQQAKADRADRGTLDDRLKRFVPRG